MRGLSMSDLRSHRQPVEHEVAHVGKPDVDEKSSPPVTWKT
jgi:hypothetical protein